MKLLYEGEIIASIGEDLELKNIVQERLLPLHFKFGGTFEEWVELRILDTKNRKPWKPCLEILQETFGASLTDNYSLELAGQRETRLRAENVMALNKTIPGTRNKFAVLLDTGGIGILKEMNSREIATVTFSAALARHLGFEAVIVKQILPGIVAESNLAEGRDFVHFESVAEDPKTFILSLGEDHFVQDFLNMMFLDALLGNKRDALFEAGLLASDGVVMKLAPMFSFTKALPIDFENAVVQEFGDKLIVEFLSFLADNKLTYIPPIVNYAEVKKLAEISLLNATLPTLHATAVTTYILDRYSLLMDELKVAYSSESAIVGKSVDGYAKSLIQNGNRVSAYLKGRLLSDD